MANFYTDNEDIKFHLGHPLMEKIVALTSKMLSTTMIKYWKLSEKFAGMS